MPQPVGAFSRVEGPACPTSLAHKSLWSFQLTMEYVSVLKLGEGDVGRVTVSSRGTVKSVPSIVSSESPFEFERVRV